MYTSSLCLGLFEKNAVTFVLIPRIREVIQESQLYSEYCRFVIRFETKLTFQDKLSTVHIQRRRIAVDHNIYTTHMFNVMFPLEPSPPRQKSFPAMLPVSTISGIKFQLAQDPCFWR